MEFLIYFAAFILGFALTDHFRSNDWKLPFLFTFSALLGFMLAPWVIGGRMATVNVTDIVKNHALVTVLFSFLLGGLLSSYKERILKMWKQ